MPERSALRFEVFGTVQGEVAGPPDAVGEPTPRSVPRACVNSWPRPTVGSAARSSTAPIAVLAPPSSETCRTTGHASRCGTSRSVRRQHCGEGVPAPADAFHLTLDGARRDACLV